MDDHRILLTGDFWHSDFQSIIANLHVPVTLVPFDKINSLSDSSYDLVVIAQSHRDQFPVTDIERIQNEFSGTPIIALLGSWCEGEVRSGTPWPGVTRVYWHQWQGRYETFVNQLGDSNRIPGWHAPLTSSVGDRILAENAAPSPEESEGIVGSIGISAWTHLQHEMLADAFNHFGWSSHWIERETMDGDLSRRMAAICVEADSWSPELNQRIQWLKKEVTAAPMILILNYPRKNELDEILQAGILEVVSKPFELNDLKTAVRRAVASRRNKDHRIPG